jgi:hypothetical protein
MKSFSWTHLAAFRLRRHHLSRRESLNPAVIAHDICGVQAQVMGCAQLALWARAPKLSKQAVNDAIWEKRSLVKTSAMRQTLHLLSATDYHLYITALKASRMAAVMRIVARVDITPAEVDFVNAALLDVLGDEPVAQRVLAEQLKPRLSEKIRAAMKFFWNDWPLFRPAVIGGRICYGPDRGREVTYVRVDRWLAAARAVDEREAKETLLRRYLRAYGPATLKDFCHWSGISTKEAQPTWNAVLAELAEVSIEGTTAWLLRDDLPQLKASKAGRGLVRLLPSFDPYMLAHEDKDHLVHPQYYKRVYRNQGWLSPVVLVDGKVAGTWQMEKGKKKSVKIELWEKLSRAVLLQIEQEAERLVGFSS